MIHMNRRTLLKSGAAAVAGTIFFPSHARAIQDEKRAVKVGRLKQSLCRWCYNKIPFPDLCKSAQEMGLPAIDLLPHADWEKVREYGLVCSMGYPGLGERRRDFIPNAFNNPKSHDLLVKELEEVIPLAAKHQVPNVIAMFGNRSFGVEKPREDKESIENCVTGLSRVKKLAEENKVTICVELLNSKVNHKDYQGDRTSFCVEVIKGVSSPYVKILYDIYHAQIMEGDVIRTIRQNKEHFAHFHTGGVPDRHELDDTQELNWRAVAKAIADTGYKGYFAHEFIPTRDPLTSLREAVVRCDV
jgi:hydroxypyruvate isomerase